MEHALQQVDILDANGNFSHTKARKDVNKATDIYHCIYTFLITPEKEVALSVIPVRSDLPNLYGNRYGASFATIRRHGETAKAAAVRGLANELHITNVEPIKVSENLEQFSDGKIVLASLFYCLADMPATFSHIDLAGLIAFNPKEVDILVETGSEEMAPTPQLLWKKYRSKLPL